MVRGREKPDLWHSHSEDCDAVRADCIEFTLEHRPSMNAALARRLSRLVPLLSLGLLAGCWAPQHHLRSAEIRPLPYSTGPGPVTRVPGIREAIQRSPDQTVRVLVVHGMLTNQRGYSARLQENVGRRLNMRLAAQDSVRSLRRGYQAVLFSGPQPLADTLQLPESTLQKSVWVSRDTTSPATLVFYEMLWAPLRDHVKARFFGCFETGRPSPSCTRFSDAAPNEDGRVLVNRLIKNNLMVDGFADATIVLGPVGDVLRDDLGLAMCYIADDVLGPPGEQALLGGVRCDPAPRPGFRALAADTGTLKHTEFFVMTHSLGSFLVMDAQERFALGSRFAEAAREDEAANFAFNLLDSATVFMRANQFALLNLAKLDAVCWTGGAACPNPSLLSADSLAPRWGIRPMTTYVAFNEVHDALGFELPPYLPDVGDYGQLVNVSVRNPGFRIPFLFKDPNAAHTASDNNPAIIEAMVEGFALPPASSGAAGRAP
jgi:hypothetical protein